MTPQPVVTDSPAPKGPIVERFEDGRRGFVITEVSNLDADSRRFFEQAVAAMERGDYNRAIELLEKVVESSPGVTAPYINLAIACNKVDKAEAAEAYLKTALDLLPGHPVASNEYGLMLRRAGRFDEARKQYEQSLMLYPDYLPIRRNLGILCDFYMNDPECALTQYESYENIAPGNEQVRLWVSELRLRLGR
jgi:Flp pilus assembly protein TadD